MKKINIIFITALAIMSITYSCKKRDDYLTGGSLHNSKFEVSTYDFLKSQPSGLFDTLIMLIDKVGLKDKINEAGTSFFAPTDYAIDRYLESRARQEQLVDEKRKWTMDSMIKYELPKFTDSINTYIVKEKLQYSNLTDDGKVYPTAKPGTSAVVSFEEITPDEADYVQLGGNPNISNNPQILFYTFLFKPLAPPVVASEITAEEGLRVRVQTSGIETTTGMIHVLHNQHILFFRKK